MQVDRNADVLRRIVDYCIEINRIEIQLGDQEL